MRLPPMPILIAALLLPVPALADVVAWSDNPMRGCGQDDRVLPAKSSGHGGFQRLDRLPPASEYLTVYRSVGGCPAPVVVRFGIGAPSLALPAAPRR